MCCFELYHSSNNHENTSRRIRKFPWIYLVGSSSSSNAFCAVDETSLSLSPSRQERNKNFQSGQLLYLNLHISKFSIKRPRRRDSQKWNNEELVEIWILYSFLRKRKHKKCQNSQRKDFPSWGFFAFATCVVGVTWRRKKCVLWLTEKRKKKTYSGKLNKWSRGLKHNTIFVLKSVPKKVSRNKKIIPKTSPDYASNCSLFSAAALQL